MAVDFFASGVAELLKELTVQVTKRIDLAWGVDGDLKKLQTSLVRIQAVLQDAEENQQAKQAGEWLERLKDVAYDADDVMDEFSYEDLRRRLEIEDGLKSKVRNFFSSSNPFAFRLKMAQKIKEINAAFDEIVKDMKEIKIMKGSILTPHDQLAAPAGDLRETTSNVDPSEIVGRKEDKEKLVTMLIAPSKEDDLRLSVIPIVGIGGLGKTTLAQLVYNDVRVQAHFTGLKKWVCVSDDFNVRKLVGDIIESAGESRPDSASTLETMAEKLRQKSGGKKFLLVLDDVWNEDRDLWEDLRKLLLCGAKGSKIIATTRSKEVANIMGTFPAHILQALSDDESWLLFKQRAFVVSQGGRGAEETQELVAIGKKIVEKCKGVPLAVKAIGGMLSSKRGKREWESILNNELWDLPEDKLKILPALRLSYDHLPSHLKQCFSFCSIFLKDEIIVVERLIQLWMAEGLLQTVQKENMEMEDVGYEYFQELFSKSFFLLDTTFSKGVPWDKISHCKMHDLFHDLAQLISRSEWCIFDVNNKIDISKMRHVRRVLLRLPSTATEIPKELGMAKKLRVILIERWGVCKTVNVSLLMNLKSLRVLSIYGIWNEELPGMIAKLKHLRYLEIGGDCKKDDDVGLSSCISRLYHLQTIKFWGFTELKQFPRIENSINLRHFDMRIVKVSASAKMPKGIGKLRFLRTLSFYRVGKEEGCHIKELKELDQIRGELRVEGLENVKSREEVMNANLKQKRLISTLHLCWSDERENNNYNEEVLEGLQPHLDLKELNIEGFKGARLPEWLTHQMLPNLVSVSLRDASKCKHLSAFGLFASLQSLNITEMNSLKCIGIEFYKGTVAHSPPPSFPCLKTLKLGWLWNLEEWVELPTSSSSSPSSLSSLSSSFPSLEILTIYLCPKLRTMPTFFPSIRELVLTRSGGAVEMMLGKCEDDEEEEENSNNIRELIPAFSTNLRELSLSHETFPSLPKRIQCFTTLESLEINEFRNMEALPEWLGNMTLLQRLLIRDCKRLLYMPSAEAMRRLCKLALLSIFECPLLSERCTKDQGQEWYKISHIPIIHID